MEDLLQLPVTLVVKAPNQKIADTRVNCDQQWTVKKLKAHLSDVYPSKPREHQQRLIYSGKLLQDDLLLKDVLHNYNSDESVHTVHLVCSSSSESSSTSPSSSPTASPSPSTSEGVRRRNVATPKNPPSAPSNPSSSSSPSSSYTSLAASPASSTSSQQSVTSSPSATVDAPSTPQQTTYSPVNPVAGGMDALQYYGMQQQQMMFPGVMYSPEQMMWMQQMYAQQMAQYMQYMQQGNMADAMPEAVAAAGVANQEPANNPAPAAANQRAGNNEPIRMNAQGGPVMDDDEEEGNRDWLDWVYTLSRFSVLLSIVYFYSTFTRFFMVFGFFFVVYAYQAGWLRVGRRQEQQQQQQEEQQQPPPAQPQPQPQQQQEADEEGTEATEEQAEDNAPPPPPPPPSTLRVMWTFLSTFFTSLVPQQPVGVQAN